ncbi:MAG: NusG domain II-containing protein [Bacteroidetes bacterium]|nr:NusG domain II-containing protein [Bacteroidota bacterium]
MISRRSFLKLSGLAVVAAGAGFGTGSMLSRGETRRFAMHGFVPDDDRVVSEFLRFFAAELPSGAAAPVITADGRWTGVVRAALRPSTRSAGAEQGSGRVHVRLVRLGQPLTGDVLVADDRKRIYDPAGDFSVALHALRSRLKGSEAQYMISAEYVEEAPLAALLSSNRVLVVENDRGIVDRIALDGISRRIDVRGAQGLTGVSVTAAGAHVHSASCRHGLCRSAGIAARPGDVIACAPNRVLLRVENA